MKEKPYQSVSVRQTLLGEEPRAVHQFHGPYGEAIWSRGKVVAVRVYLPHRDGGSTRAVKVQSIPGLDAMVTRNAVGDTTVVYFREKET